MPFIFLLTGVGIASGILAGLLGIGGGTLIVPILLMLHFQPVQAVATSTLAILVTAMAGSDRNWQMGYLQGRSTLQLGLPALVTAQLGTYCATQILPYLLLTGFGLMLLANIYLMDLRHNLVTQDPAQSPRTKILFLRIVVGAIAGFLAGLFGVGGGTVLVPLQMLWLAEPIKSAIQTSLGVIVITALSAVAGHAIAGNILVGAGLALGLGGIVGVQLSTHYLPKLSDSLIKRTFRIMLFTLSLHIFSQAWSVYLLPQSV